MLVNLPYRKEPWDPEREVLVSDGGWGTELQRRGLPLGSVPDEWCLSAPGSVADVARAYVEAGASIVGTNTFGASRISLARHGLARRAAEINRIAAGISREAARGRALVCGSIGPCGQLLATGEVGEQELLEAFSEQAVGLEAGGADWIVVESMFDAREMAIAVRASRAATGLPVAASVTYNPPAYRTMMGDTVEDCARMAQVAGAFVVGTNCGHGVTTFPELVRRIRAATTLPVWAYANAGLPRVAEGKAVYDMSADVYASAALELVGCGASIIGGCCGTTPEFIRRIREGLDRRRSA